MSYNSSIDFAMELGFFRRAMKARPDIAQFLDKTTQLEYFVNEDNHMAYVRFNYEFGFLVNRMALIPWLYEMTKANEVLSQYFHEMPICAMVRVGEEIHQTEVMGDLEAFDMVMRFYVEKLYEHKKLCL